MKKFTFILLLFLMSINFSSAQSGYIGNKKFAEIKLNQGISTKRIYKISNGVVKSRPKFYTDFNINLGFAPLRQFEFNFGYGYSLLRPDLLYLKKTETFIDSSTGQNLTFDNNFRAFDNIQFAFHSIKFEFKYFIKGNLAPVGKFFGLGFFSGIGKTNTGTLLNYGNYGEVVTEKKFSKTYKLTDLGEFTFNEENKVNATMITLIAGQNYPLTERLMLSMQIVYPFLYFYPNNVFWTGTMWSRNINGNSIDENYPSLVNAMGQAVLNNNQLKLDIGIRFFF